MRGGAGRVRKGGASAKGRAGKGGEGRGRGRRQGRGGGRAALAPGVASRSSVLREVSEDVTALAGGDPRTMLALLGATTLVLVAAVRWMLPAAAGERRGGPAQARGGARGWAVGALEALAPGGGWKGLARCPGDLCSSGVTALRSKIGRKWCSKDPCTPLAWGPAYRSPSGTRPPRRLCGLSPPRRWVSESLPVDFLFEKSGSRAGPLSNKQGFSGELCCCS